MSIRISSLVANEYKVLFWVDQHYHFGHKVTSELEGNHAQLKNYLNTSTGHLKDVVDKLRLYWNNQAVAYWQKCAAQKRITNSLYAGNPIFAQVLGNVHDYPFKIVEEIAKIPKDYANWKPPCICTCSARTSFGVPCVHTIWNCKIAGEPLHMLHFHEHWWFKRPSPGSSNSIITVRADQVYDPRIVVKRKGRAKGSKNIKRRKTDVGRGSTVLNRREPSGFEIPNNLSTED
ncbi:hypothetical protein K3495_g5643 [Podosphaera aphanis]|nr:hypothetical protein K3495_g5643 [Podosphaera aphanis]